MMYMLDTNILIYFIKNRPESVAAKIDALPQEAALCMSFITYAELLKGAERSARKSHVLGQLDTLIKLVPVAYPTTHAICRHYAEQFTRLKQSGTLIGGNDLWIACHALASGATLVSHNTQEFARIDGLILEDWAA